MHDLDNMMRLTIADKAMIAGVTITALFLFSIALHWMYEAVALIW